MGALTLRMEEGEGRGGGVQNRCGVKGWHEGLTRGDQCSLASIPPSLGADGTDRTSGKGARDGRVGTGGVPGGGNLAGNSG